MTILYIIPLLQKKSSEKSQKLSKLYIFAILYNLSKYNLDIMSKRQNDAQNQGLLKSRREAAAGDLVLNKLWKKTRVAEKLYSGANADTKLCFVSEILCAEKYQFTLKNYSTQNLTGELCSPVGVCPVLRGFATLL